MSFFGRLFDFNRDGETDFSEELLGLGMIAAVAGAAEEEEQLQRELDEKLAELEDKLLDWECEEPDDVLSSAYDAWEEGREQLEDAISDLEDLLDE